MPTRVRGKNSNAAPEPIEAFSGHTVDEENIKNEDIPVVTVSEPSVTSYKPPKYASDEDVVTWAVESGIFRPSGNEKVYWEGGNMTMLKLATILKRFADKYISE